MKFVDRFRKHDFSIEERVDTCIERRGSDGVLRPVRYMKFTCSKCGKSLALDRWQMKSLPWRMSRGCSGERNTTLTEAPKEAE